MNFINFQKVMAVGNTSNKKKLAAKQDHFKDYPGILAYEYYALDFWHNFGQEEKKSIISYNN